MAEISGLITLDQFVRDLLFKMEKPNDDYFRYFKIASDGLRHLFMHQLGYVTHTKLTVDTDTNTINFPDDYVGYISLNVPNAGRKWSFTRDDSIISTTSTDDEGNEYLDADAGEGVNLGEEVSYSGYGARGGINDYYFSIDHRNRRFIISGLSADFVVLTYVSTGINATAATYIPRYAEDVLEQFIRWKDAEYKDDQTQLFKAQQFEKAVRQMKKFNAPSLQEIRDAIMRSSNQVLHR